MGTGLLLVVKAVLTILPVIMQMVQTNQIKTGAYDEVIDAFSALIDKRIAAAQKAAKEPPVDESTDPNNRSR